MACRAAGHFCISSKMINVFVGIPKFISKKTYGIP